MDTVHVWATPRMSFIFNMGPKNMVTLCNLCLAVLKNETVLKENIVAVKAMVGLLSLLILSFLTISDAGSEQIPSNSLNFKTSFCNFILTLYLFQLFHATSSIVLISQSNKPITIHL